MAAAVMPGLDTVCFDPRCGHRDCRATRELASRRCALCDLAVLPGERFFQEHGWRLLAHELCVLSDLDGWRSARQAFTS